MTTTTLPAHPFLAAAETIEAALSEVGEVNPSFMSTDDKARSLIWFAELESRLHEARLRLLTVAGDVAETTAARDSAAWAARATRSRLDSARADARLAEALDRRYLHLAEAMRDGRANLEQTQTIVRALDKLGGEIDAETMGLAEDTLIDHCAELTPTELAHAGRRILEHVAPEIAEELMRKQLEDEEKSASEKQRLNLKRCGDGTTRISGLLSDQAATRLAGVLQAFANPRRHGTPDGELHPSEDPAVTAFMKLPYPRRLAEAFTALLEAIDPVRLPIHGGDATTLVVTIGLKELKEGLAAGTIHGVQLPGDDSAATLDRLSAGEVRRLACNAQIIPAVLGGDSQILDLGHRERLFSSAQRKAMLLRDQTCRAEGCDIPGTWSEAHHWVHWADGGPTDLTNAVLLCRHHHMRVHDPAYTAERLSSGDVRYHRRR